MTNDEIIAMAREAGHPYPEVYEQFLQCFAELVAKAEREKCVNTMKIVLEQQTNLYSDEVVRECIDAIRARGAE